MNITLKQDHAASSTDHRWNHADSGGGSDGRSDAPAHASCSAQNSTHRTCCTSLWGHAIRHRAHACAISTANSAPSWPTQSPSNPHLLPNLAQEAWMKSRRPRLSLSSPCYCHYHYLCDASYSLSQWTCKSDSTVFLLDGQNRQVSGIIYYKVKRYKLHSLADWWWPCFFAFGLWWWCDTFSLSDSFSLSSSSLSCFSSSAFSSVSKEKSKNKRHEINTDTLISFV